MGPYGAKPSFVGGASSIQNHPDSLFTHPDWDVLADSLAVLLKILPNSCLLSPKSTLDPYGPYGSFLEHL